MQTPFLVMLGIWLLALHDLALTSHLGTSTQLLRHMSVFLGLNNSFNKIHGSRVSTLVRQLGIPQEFALTMQMSEHLSCAHVLSYVGSEALDF